MPLCRRHLRFVPAALVALCLVGGAVWAGLPPVRGGDLHWPWEPPRRPLLSFDATTREELLLSQLVAPGILEDRGTGLGCRLCMSFELDPERQRLILTLPENRRLHDGRALTASAIAAALEDARQRESAWHWLLEDVISWEAVTPTRLVLQTQGSPRRLAQRLALPVATLAFPPDGPDTPLRRRMPRVGWGPFRAEDDNLLVRFAQPGEQGAWLDRVHLGSRLADGNAAAVFSAEPLLVHDRAFPATTWQPPGAAVHWLRLPNRAAETIAPTVRTILAARGLAVEDALRPLLALLPAELAGYGADAVEPIGLDAEARTTNLSIGYHAEHPPTEAMLQRLQALALGAGVTVEYQAMSPSRFDQAGRTGRELLWMRTPLLLDEPVMLLQHLLRDQALIAVMATDERRRLLSALREVELSDPDTAMAAVHGVLAALHKATVPLGTEPHQQPWSPLIRGWTPIDGQWPPFEELWRYDIARQTYLGAAP